MSGTRSALSESLLGNEDSRGLQRHSEPLPHISVDVQSDSSRSRPRSSRARGTSFAIGENANNSSSSYDLASPSPDISKFGTSPLLGAPWPYLTRPQQSHPTSVASSPRRETLEHRLSGDGNRLGSTDSGRLPSAQASRRSQLAEQLDETLSEADEEDLSRASSDGVHKSDIGNGDGHGGDDHHKGKTEKAKARLAVLTNDATYGIINSIVGIPTLISFANIIFSHKLFNPYIGQLARITFLSSAIHQAIFTIFSTLPFAVGQVQDVGLIFLSAMATSIANSGLDNGDSKADILGTTLVTLTISTLIVGLLIILVGQFKLASLVQYVPLSTVGGYLGYVGYFCLAAGLGLACNCAIDSFPSWANLFHQDQLIKLGPVLGSTAALYLTMHYVHSPLALPAVIVIIPAIFHIVLLCKGWTLADAAKNGWVTQGEEGVSFWKLYAMYNIKDWSLSTIDKLEALKQVPKLLALFFVVAFGSSLDVAAIQAGVPDPLDFNHELKTVGASNLVAGLLGAGFTGSYIFSQTIFSMRANVKTRVHGFIIAGLEFTLFAIPISVMQYLPNFFFGSLLALFGVEIILDWLILSFSKVLLVEFILLWATYLAIMFTNLEAGIGIGIVLATIYFAFSYARVHIRTFSVVPSRSAVVRGMLERSVLEVFMARMATLSLSGYIFFGSSVSIARKVTDVAAALKAREEDIRTSLQTPGASAEKEIRSGNTLWTGPMAQKTRDAFLASPMFILLDFRAVAGLDATAAQSFGTLWVQLKRQGIELVLTHLKSSSMQRLLEAHGVVVDLQSSMESGPTDAARVFGSMDEGVQHCEEAYLDIARQFGLCEANRSIMTLEDTLKWHSSQSHIPALMAGKPLDYAQYAQALHRHMEEKNFEEGETIMDWGQEASHLFILQEGNVCVEEDYLQKSQDENLVPIPESIGAERNNRVFKYGPGAIVGLTDWFLERPRSCHAYAGTRCRAHVIDKTAFDKLSVEAPDAVVVLMTIIARMAILNEVHVAEYLERINAT